MKQILNRRHMKKTVYFILFLTLSISALFFFQVWQNNRDIPAPATAEIQQHFDRSINWLNDNYAQLKDSNNPILWWFIKQAALTSDDKTLDHLFKQYKKERIDSEPVNLSTPMFEPLYRPRIPDISAFSGLDAYQIFLFYGFSCDADLGSEPLIQQQLEPDFCSLHFIHPRCVTHQLMGLRFMQRFECGNEDKVANTISTLQETLVTELTWDFRVTDSYIQRVLLLLDTGAYDKIKPVWIKNILLAQNPDGSWDDLLPLLPLSDGRVLALTSTTVKIQKQKASFHASAQAIWLLSMLIEESGHQRD